MEVFTIAPANARILWLVGLVPLVVLVIVMAVLWASISGAQTARFELSPEGLRLRGDWYGRLIPADHLVRGAARRVDFAQAPDLLPARKTLGTSFSGYQAGWFVFAMATVRSCISPIDRRRSTFRRPTDTVSCSVRRSPTGFCRRSTRSRDDDSIVSTPNSQSPTPKAPGIGGWYLEVGNWKLT
jgi:hypothetical protein